MAEVITVEEAVVATTADFDFDITPVIRWRGLGRGRRGACCYIDPTDPDAATTLCIDQVRQSDCDTLGGGFVPDQRCIHDPCPGACCEDDGAGNFLCEDLSQSDCDAAGGVFKGVNTACDDVPDPCIVGACCQSTGCTDETEGDCGDLGGTWISGSHCADTPDPCLGACCILDITTPCQDLNESDCNVEDGGFQGIGTSCPDAACTVGACCLADVCQIETETGCSDLGGEFQGAGVDCTPDPCAATGACCDGTTCSEATEEDCVDLIGGVYQGDDVPCDPNPCVTTGACCQSGGVCSEETRGDCANLGGIYQGDGTPCNPCVCPSISMVCDSTAASGSKCGATNPADGKIYKTSVSGIHPTGGFTQNSECTVDGNTPHRETLHTTFAWDVYRLNTTTFTDSSGTCTSSASLTCGGTSSYTGDNNNCPSCGDSGSCDYSNCAIFDVGAGPPACSWAIDDPCIFIVTAAGCKGSFCVYSNRGGTPQFDVNQYSNEYTTAELISNVTGRLAFTGNYFGGACASSRFLSSDEHTYSVQRSRPRFLFGTHSVNFTLTYDEVFTPSGGGGGSTVSRSFSVSAGTTSLDGPELDEPSTNGTISIVNIRCTLA